MIIPNQEKSWSPQLVFHRPYSAGGHATFLSVKIKGYNSTNVDILLRRSWEEEKRNKLY